MQDNTDAVLAVLKDSGQKLHAVLLRLTLRADIAEDLLQELFLKLNRSVAFAGASNRAAYAYRAAVHLAFDWRRSRQKLTIGLDLSNHVEYAPSPLQTLVAQEQMERVLDVAGTLPELQRQALVLRYIQQESFHSIAVQLERTPHQIRALCHKAIRQLRRRLAVESAPEISQELPRGQDS